MSWSAGTTAPVTFDGAFAAPYAGKIYVFGGEGTSPRVRVNIYDPGAGTWSTGTSAPSDLDWLSSAGTIGSKIYVLGWSCNLFWIYDPVADTWTNKTSGLPSQFGSTGQFSGCTDGTKYWALRRVDSSGRGKPMVYDPGTDTWDTTTYPQIPSGIAPNGTASGALFRIGNELIYCNGWNASPDGIVARLDVVTSGASWVAGATNATHLEDFPPTIDGAPLPILIGGDGSGITDSTSVRVYDPTTNTWSSGPALTTSRTAACAAIIGTTLHVIGGTSGGTALATVEHAPLTDFTPPTSVATSVPIAWSATVSTLVPTSSWVGDDVDQWQVPFLWSATAEIEPVEDPPPASDPYIQRVSLTMPAPTFVAGRPDSTWVPSISRSDWGRLQLIINGHDMSRPRGKSFIPLTDSHQDPFGDGEAAFAFPGLTEFDSHSAWNLSALAPVTLRRKDPGGVFHTLYEGVVASVEPSTEDGLVVQCIGALFRMDLLREPPPLLTVAHDYGDLIAWAFNRKIDRHALNVARMTHVATGQTGVATSDFQQFLTGAIQDYLSALQALGHQYTVQLARPRTPRLVLRDTTTVHATVSFGAPGVDCQLSVDFTTATTAVYGSGSNGHCTWMGARFPNLTQQDVPAFPLAVGSVFVAGDGHSGFAPFANFLRRGQYGTIVSDDTYDGADFDNVEQFQDRAGITIDGIVGAQTWEAAFQPGANQGSLSGAYVDTIYEYIATRKRLYNAQGADVGANPNFDPSVARIEDYIPFGDNVSKNLGRRSAKQIMSQAYPAAWTGTITLTSDPTEMSRFDLYSGQNIAVENFGGETLLLHITRRERDWKGGAVTLTVDERARDWETAAAIHQRRQDVSDLTRRQKFGRTKSKVFNDYGAWLCEDGAGEIPLMNQQGGFWNVQRIAAAPKGTIARISLAMGSGLTEHSLNQAVAHRIDSVSGAARGAVLIFDSPITPRSIDSLTGMATPITDLADGTAPVDHNQDALNALGLVYAAGGPGAAIGFYPNNDPGDGSSTHLTGMFEDGGGIDFGPTGHYWLWVAIWTSTSCKVGGRIFPGPPN